MSGLELEKCRILEVAAIVTDGEFNELETFHRIVYQPQAVLDAMDEWCQNQHGKSGLTEEVKSGTDEKEVERDLMDLLTRHWKKGDRPILCGNSIGTDKAFLEKYMPDFHGKLHYRVLDVSSWKIIFESRFAKTFKKSDTHRALDDIRQSIEELKYYLSFVNTDSH